jgi:hypothetical protein
MRTREDKKQEQRNMNKNMFKETEQVMSKRT